MKVDQKWAIGVTLSLAAVVGYIGWGRAGAGKQGDETPPLVRVEPGLDGQGVRREEDVATAAKTPAAEKAGAGRTCLRIALPEAKFGGTPKDVRSDHLEPDRKGAPRPPVTVPSGCDRVISRDCKVSSSDPVPIIGELFYITDGEKEHDAATYVELGPGTQWVQIDLGQEREIHAACVWHYHGEARIYFDVVCRVSNDPEFKGAVTTVFNNDGDDSSGFGVGKDLEYIETNEGRPFAVNGVKGRYVRFSSRGNTANEMNHYTEVEIYGRE